MTETKPFDIMIVGTGPAGLTAALYGQRLGLNCVVFGFVPGGNLYMVDNLANFPGFPGGISGTEWGVKTFQQAQGEGGLFPMSRLVSLDKDGDLFTGVDSNGMSYSAMSAVVATGRVPRKLESVPSNLKGINVCSVCDGPLFRGKNATLAVVGSDNAAAQHALTLSRIATKVIVVFRSRDPKMDAVHRGEIAAQNNIDLMPETSVTGYKGLDILEALEIEPANGDARTLPVDGVFLAIGWTPCTELIEGSVDTIEGGYLKTDEKLMTSLPGMFAAGDVRDTDLYQVLTACADGARCALNVASFIKRSLS
ncbi:MAG: NAD(P)/FAD-dependent oxidoreductase [Deltaproteobacteria bacterium]|nr:NAD(P)/FAD-dependent oxidoreductase [Deltaproteobacteria bacterium]